MIEAILQKNMEGEPLTKEDGLALLQVSNTGEDYYRLIERANAASREQFEGKGYIFAQIGLNAAPCSGNCKFCSMAKDRFCVEECTQKTKEQVLEEAEGITREGISALFLMTTADYNFDMFIEIASAVRAAIPKQVNLVANIGDFSVAQARRLKEAGFQGAYHIVRMREGVDTDLPVAQRIQTLDAIRTAGLKLYYCVEPIGVEHTYEELVTEMLRAREYEVEYMAVMRRVNVPGSHYEGQKEVSDLEMVKIAAVTRLMVMPKISMNLHETLSMSLLAGVNQLYAEYGVNPRDNKNETQDNRGIDVAKARDILNSFGYTV